MIEYIFGEKKTNKIKTFKKNVNSEKNKEKKIGETNQIEKNRFIPNNVIFSVLVK
jgi:hypothetical protein